MFEVRDSVTTPSRQAEGQANAEASAREELARLRRLLAQTPALLWATDTDLRFTAALGAEPSSLKPRPKQVLGMSLYEFFQTDDPNYPPIAASRRALRGEQSTYEDLWAGNSYQVRIEPLFDARGQLIGTVGAALDITERRRTDAAVRRRDSILEAVSFAAARFLATTGWQQCIEDVLKRLGTAADVSRVYMFENHTGADGALLTSQRYEWVAPGIPRQIGNPELQGFSYRETGFQRWEEHLGRGDLIGGHARTFPAREHALLAAHGIDSIVVVPIFVGQTWWGHIGFDQCGSERVWSGAEMDALKAAAGILGATIQREQAEATLRDTQAEHIALERKLLETQKLESLGVLAGGIAHDFNNVLMAILGNAQLARFDLPAGVAAHESLAQIEIAAQRAVNLISQMLAYAGKGRVLVQIFDLNLLVEEITALLNVSIAKMTSLRYRLAPQLPPIEGDTAQLRQVVMNLVMNAAEAVGEAQGQITLSTGVRHVDRAYLATTWLAPDLPEGKYVYLEVADNGHGMDAETLAKIFDPFFTTKFTGRGLGLAAVLGIVRGHGGTLKVWSAPAQGTIFTVLLPCVPHLLAPPEVEPFGNIASGSTKDEGRTTNAGLSSSVLGAFSDGFWDRRLEHPPAAPAEQAGGLLLVVDDEEGVRSIAARMLERAGFSVLTAADGPSGVELLRAHAGTIAAVLLDLNMQWMSGEETLQAMRRIKPDVPVIITSGHAEQELAERCAGMSPAGFLQKPFSSGTLGQKVRHVLAKTGAT